MRQLTDAEKQQLETKIEKEQERQRTLRETNPDLPESFEKASAKKHLARRLTPKHLWKYGLLGLILCLLVFNVYRFLKWRDFGSNNIINLNLMIALMLLINHIAFNFTKTGWKSRVMKMVAFIGIVFVLVYMYIAWVA